MPRYIMDEIGSEFASVFHLSKQDDSHTLESELELHEEYESLIDNQLNALTDEQRAQAEPYQITNGILAALDKVLGDVSITGTPSAPNPREHYNLIKTIYSWFTYTEEVHVDFERKHTRIVYVRDENGSHIRNGVRYRRKRETYWEDENASYSKQKTWLKSAKTYKTTVETQYSNATLTSRVGYFEIRDSNGVVYRYEGSTNGSENMPDIYRPYLNYMIDVENRESDSDIRSVQLTANIEIPTNVVTVEDNYATLRGILEDHEINTENNLELILTLANQYDLDFEYVAEGIGFGTYTELDFNPNIPVIQGNGTRDDLIRVATSIENLPYFWGGKWPSYGANPNWGKLKIVTAAGNWATGSPPIPYGLDCTGYLDWVFYQFTGEALSNRNASRGMWNNSYSVSVDELLPGDIGFYQYGGGIHVGIFIGRHNGHELFIHAGGRTWKTDTRPGGRVVITYNNTTDRYLGSISTKFKYFRRPYIDFEDN